MVPKSSLKVLKAKNSSLVTRCEIGDSLVSTWKLVKILLWRGGLGSIDNYDLNDFVLVGRVS